MADLIGQILLNRYRVTELLGRGGMAQVYKVWDQQRTVFLAMKVLHDDLARDKVFLRRFAREAQILNQLQHPHIVRYYGLEQEGLQAFLLMDYVQGSTLRDEIFQLKRPMTEQRILEVMRPICSALNYAHQLGLVHCDVKPANIMIQDNGNILVADFGIARLIENSTTTTMSGAGTPAYMSPEQALGKKPAPQTDIYALGIVLYEMLTGGERPFTGEQAQTEGSTAEKLRWEQITLKPPSPRKYNPAISRNSEEVVLKCLEKDPTQRYASAFELLQTIGSALGSVKDAQGFTTGIKQEKPKPQQEIQAQKMSAAFSSGSRFSTRAVGWFAMGVLAIALLIGFIGWKANKGIAQAAIPAIDAMSTSALQTVQAGITQTAMYRATDSPPYTVTLFTPTPLATATPELGIGSTTIGADGMTLVYVPEGEFTMGSEDGSDDEKPVHQVYLDAYWIDQTEVTNKQYAACVSGGNCTPPSNTSSYTRSSYYGNSQFDDYPVIYVDWDQANAYCSWAGRRLPTEAEWEKAARDNDRRTYPWGNDAPNNNLLNYNSSVGDTTEVGKYPHGASPYGIYDMAGNVWEWVKDWYSKTYYQSSPSLNPLGPNSGQHRAIRGGSWDGYGNYLRSAFRDRYVPADSDYFLGFRCACSTSP